jgi:TIR domain
MRRAPNGEPASERLSNPSVFISYAHEDKELAIAFSNMLNQTFGRALAEVFLDMKSIPLGEDIGADIKEALRRTDVLIILSTGALRGSHSWGGFELGYFEACHPGPYPDNSIRGKAISISRQEDIPIKNRKHVPLIIYDHLINEKEQDLEVQIEVSEHDPLVRLLGDLFLETNGERLDSRRDVTDDYIDKVKQFKKAVYIEFSNRIRNIVKPQKQLLIKYNSRLLDRNREDLPADATITSIGGAMDVFGIPEEDPAIADVEAKEIPLLDSRGMGAVKAKQFTWQKFCERIAGDSLADHWRSTLSRIVLPSTGGQNVNVDSSQVIASHTKAHRYRLILTTSTRYYNGNIEASVYLVESLQRNDYGRQDITLLLKGLHIVCRFRYAFLDPKSEFHAINVAKWKPAEAPALARQLLTELDCVYAEARDAQLDKPGDWAEFVPVTDLQAMGLVWAPLEAEIRAICAAIIENEGDEAKCAEVVLKLTAKLETLIEQVTPNNVALLKAMSVKLSQIASS